MNVSLKSRFSEEIREIENFPAQWAGRKSLPVGLALGAIGLWNDLGRLRTNLKQRFPDEDLSRLEESEARRISEVWRKQDSAAFASRLAPLARFSSDMKVELPTLLSAVAEDHEHGRVLKAALLTQWYALLGHPEVAIQQFESVLFHKACDPFSAAAYIRSLKQVQRHVDARDFIIDYGNEQGADNLHANLALLFAEALFETGRQEKSFEISKALCEDAYSVSGQKVAPWIKTRALDIRLQYLKGAENAKQALSALDQHLEKDPGNETHLARRLKLVWRSFGVDRAERDLWSCIEKFPLSPAVLNSALTIPFSDQVIERLLDSQLEVLSTSEGTRKQVLSELLICSLIANRMDAAVHLAEQIREFSTLAKLVLNGNLRQSSRLAGNWTSGPFQIAQGKDSNTTVLLLPGFRRLFWGLPPRVMDSYFSQRNINAVYCNDPSNKLFLQGVPGYGDTFEELLGYLRTMPCVSEAETLLVLGVCVGGFSAIGMGLGLGADHCLAYSPRTTIVKPDAPINDPALIRGASVFKDIPPQQTDLCQAWPADTKMQTQIFYGNNAPVDRFHAERLSGYPGVRLVTIEGLKEHDSFTRSLENGELQKELDRILETGTRHH